jgi:hypothetical protein
MDGVMWLIFLLVFNLGFIAGFSLGFGLNRTEVMDYRRAFDQMNVRSKGG